MVDLTIDSMVQQLAPKCSLLKTFVAVHIAYNTVKSHVQQFHQLVSLKPKIVKVLIASVPNPAIEMVCFLCGCLQGYIKHVHH